MLSIDQNDFQFKRSVFVPLPPSFSDTDISPVASAANDQIVASSINVQTFYLVSSLNINKVRLKRSYEILTVPDTNLSSQISKGDLVMCSVIQGLNLGVVLEIIDQPSSQASGQLLGFPTTKEIKTFQNKMKREVVLLQLCRDYLIEFQFRDIILIDIESNANESITLYCHIKNFEELENFQLSLQTLLAGHQLHVIQIFDSSLFIEEEQFVSLTLPGSLQSNSDASPSDELLDIVDSYLANESDGESDGQNEIENDMSHFHLYLPQKILEKQHSNPNGLSPSH